MRIKEKQLRKVIREFYAVRIDPKTDRMLHGVRSALGEKEFVDSLLAKIDSRDLREILRSIAHDKRLEIDGIQYMHKAIK